AQRLAHPRKYLPTPEQDPEFREAQRIEILDESVLYYPSNAVARPIQEATCELALALLGETADPSARDASEGITREKVGPLETEYAAPLVRKQGLARFPAVWTRIQPLLRHAQGGTVTRG
ncbi:MAG: DnaT-like ssDNA-binding protein, partial [Gemmatimonadota bacterium]